MPQVDFIPFAGESTADIVAQSTYAASPIVANGFGVGFTSQQYFNKAFRQSSAVSAALANVIANTLGEDVLDNSSPTTLQSQISRSFASSATAANVAALRGISPLDGRAMATLGYYSEADGGQGLYAPATGASAGTYVDDAATIIVPTGGDGSSAWLLLHNGTISIRQFGCHPTKSAAINTARLQAAINWQTATFADGLFPTSTTRRLYAPAGLYLLSGGVTKAAGFDGVTMSGDGSNSTVFQWDTADCLQIIGGSGGLNHAAITDIGFKGVSTSILTDNIGCDGQRYIRCKFFTSLIGGRFYNRDSGMFTEYVHYQDCDFEPDCTTKLAYRRDSGDASFNGSGMTGLCTVDTNSSQIVIDIGAGCQPYNAPLHMQVWAKPSVVIIRNQNSSSNQFRPTFFGQINLEPTGSITLGTSPTGDQDWDIIFTGKILSNNQSITFGTLLQCEWAALLSSGAQQVGGARWSTQRAMTTGANNIKLPNPLADCGLQLWVRLDATNYNYRYKVEFFGNGTTAVVTNFLANNTAGYGAPTFALTSPNFVITNASFPSSGVTVSIDLVQTAQAPSGLWVG